MRIKGIIYLLCACAIVVGVVVHPALERGRYERAIRALQVRLAEAEESPDTFFIHDSIPVWRERVVEVDRTDYKKVLADRETIRQLGLRVRELEGENRLLLETRDTIYLSTESKDTVEVLSYRDKWSDFVFYRDENRLEYSVRDSLTTYVSREYKHRFLWFRWGVKGYHVTNVSHNPNCRVEYNKYIKVK